MSDAPDQKTPPADIPADFPTDLPPAAKRALAEAEARRKKARVELPVELGGRDGPDPVRHGDWENKGIAKDF